MHSLSSIHRIWKKFEPGQGFHGCTSGKSHWLENHEKSRFPGSWRPQHKFYESKILFSDNIFTSGHLSTRILFDVALFVVIYMVSCCIIVSIFVARPVVSVICHLYFIFEEFTCFVARVIGLVRAVAMRWQFQKCAFCFDTHTYFQRIQWVCRLYESLGRKPGWRFTARCKYVRVRTKRAFLKLSTHGDRSD